MHKKNKNFLFLVVFTFFNATLDALPIGFYHNQGPIPYSEVKNDSFIIYHDARTPHEARQALDALTQAKTVLEPWFQVQRSSPLPVIMTATTQYASFANLVMDAIELQTTGLSDRDLFLHEYVHSTMYRHFDTFLGPVGNIVITAWMPAWFIEGLAESLSVSIGSDTQAGIERYQALTGEWPSFEKLHSLYSKNSFAYRGYATSGGFVSYILRRGQKEKLPDVLRSFKSYALPWWWPWAAIPFNGFMPMDKSLEEILPKKDIANGTRELYLNYQKDALKFWQEKTKDREFLLQRLRKLETSSPKLRRKLFAYPYSVKTDGLKATILTAYNDEFYEANLQFDEASGVAVEANHPVKQIAEKLPYTLYLNNPRFVARMTVSKNYRGFEDRWYLEIKKTNQKRFTKILSRKARMSDFVYGAKEFFWSEQEYEKTRLCSIRNSDLLGKKKGKSPRVICHIESEVPKKLSIIGSGNDEIWLDELSQSMSKDHHQIKIFNTKTLTLKDFKIQSAGAPLKIATTHNGVWALMAEHSERVLRKFSLVNGSCVGMLRFKDHLLDLHGFSNGDLILTLYAGEQNPVLMRLKAEELKEEACTRSSEHLSPIMAAFRLENSQKTQNDKKPVSLTAALQSADIWRNETQDAAVVDEQQINQHEPLLGNTDNEQTQTVSRNHTRNPSAKWRGRHVITSPWIGGEDVQGLQYGLISIPLMDHMQNETVRATILYGPQSRFLNSAVSFISTRFVPTITLDGMRQQTFNAYDGNNQLSYYDERSGIADIAVPLYFDSLVLGLGAHFKASHLKPYIGNDRIRQGRANEVGARMNVGMPLALDIYWNNNVSFRDQPASINENFEYNVLSFASELSRPMEFLSSRLSLGIEGSRTRGPKPRLLREFYRPLKTFVPGSGGGYNKNNFPLIGQGWLFDALYGENQARAKGEFTFPLIPEVDKLFYILYVERLDFTAFYNYGGAWSNKVTPPKERLIASHGYNLDLQLDLKGVRFNLGLGTGQVIGKPFEGYVTSGFDAIF